MVLVLVENKLTKKKCFSPITKCGNNDYTGNVLGSSFDDREK